MIQKSFIALPVTLEQVEPFNEPDLPRIKRPLPAGQLKAFRNSLVSCIEDAVLNEGSVAEFFFSNDDDKGSYTASFSIKRKSGRFVVNEGRFLYSGCCESDEAGFDRESLLKERPYLKSNEELQNFFQVYAWGENSCAIYGWSMVCPFSGVKTKGEDWSISAFTGFSRGISVREIDGSVSAEEFRSYKLKFNGPAEIVEADVKRFKDRCGMLFVNIDER